VIFWVIPLMAIVPMDLFPKSLLAMAIGLGLVDANLAVLLGAWLYTERP
jgi:dipeptide/tripeptide permease